MVKPEVFKSPPAALLILQRGIGPTAEQDSEAAHSMNDLLRDTELERCPLKMKLKKKNGN